MRLRVLFAGTFFLVLAAGSPPAAAAAARPDATVGGNRNGGLIPTGLYITPLVTPGSTFQRLTTGLRPDGTADADGAITSALSPDGKTLLVITAGYNDNFYTTAGAPITTPYRNPATGKPTGKTSNTFQWVFVYDVSGRLPVQEQRIMLTSSFDGLAWDPSGTIFYVSGGHDDCVYIYKNRGGVFRPDAPFVVLNHAPNTHNDYNSTPQTAGLSVSADGKTLYVANYNNNSVSVVDTTTRQVVNELTMPGPKDLGGDFPIWVTPHTGAGGKTDKFYVSCVRDGQVAVFTSSGAQESIAVGGEPGKSILSSDGTRLYVANPNLDQIDQIDTKTDILTRVIDVRRPGYPYHGSNPNSLALNASGSTLYVTISGENAIGVIDLASGELLGRIPTAWLPSSVQVSADGTRLYVSNMKMNTGPNPFNDPPAAVAARNTTSRNDYDLANLKGGLAVLPIPDSATLSYLSAIVDANNSFTTTHGVTSKMLYLRSRIKHVIFIQKENRTYDQVLGDLPEGNGDPRLTLFPQPLTPNFHSLAMQFADLDNYYTSGDVSQDGWNWDFEGYSNDINRQGTPLNYAGDGDLQSSIFGGININGAVDVFGNHAVEDNAGTSDLRRDQTGGYLWDTALRAGLSIRHYSAYLAGPEKYVRHADRVGAVQGYPQYKTLTNYTNPYFYQWDTNIPDEWRYEVWKDQFDQDVKNGTMPAFQFMCIMMDHTGSFDSNVANLDTPELDVASNDHAIGQIVDAVSHSPLWASTAIFIVEDDSQSGPDHIDSHRSPIFVISPYTLHNSVVHSFYATPNMDRTMEDLLGMDHLGFNDANAASMDDVFATKPDLQPYNVLIPGVLCQPPVKKSLVPACHDPSMRSRITPAIAPLRNGSWWIRNTKGLSFRHPDENDADSYNRLLWKGIAGDNIAYSVERSGQDLSENRAAFLKTVSTTIGSSR
jgi:YVTN family beta-propeller protein